MKADEKLRRYAKPAPGERWYFSSPASTHDRESALQVIDACLVLGVPVTDTVSAGTWLRLIDSVATLESRIATLEARA